MDDYQLWNDALARRFFNPDQAGRNVRLYVTRNLIDEMQTAMPDAGTFRMAVVGSPLSPHRDGVCQRALQAFENWRDRRNKGWEFPPYIGYLSLFVLASDIDGDYSPNAYYPRLWELLTDECRSGRVPSFDRMHLLWQDLETWTMDDLNGELGLFQARSVGGYVHVGYPICQSLLVEQERRDLPLIFYNAELDPATQHSPDELARALRRPFARQFLRAKTNRLVENPQDAGDLYNAMLEAVAGELAEWDGSSPSPGQTGDNLSPTFLGLRICIDLDRVAGIARVSLRCKLNQRRRDFPEDGLTIEGGLEAAEAWNGWSSPVKNSTSGEVLDASNLDWRNGTTMRTVNHGWRLKLQAREVRIFTSGLAEGLSGLIETHLLPQGQQFYLSYPTSIWPRLEHWATTQCRGFQEINIVRGFPEGWRLAEFQEALTDEHIWKEIAGLSFSRETRLQLIGGIRSERGNTFFDFAPPSVALSGGSASTTVYCNGQPLLPKNNGVFELPDNLPKESRIRLAVRQGQSLLDSLSLFLSGDFSVARREPEYFLDSSGASIPCETSEFTISGALVKGLASQTAITTAELIEDLVHEMGGKQGYLIGQQPGQIAMWPSELFPTGWMPAWIIKKSGKKLAAVFVNEILASTTAASNPTPTPSRRRVQDWKKVLWHWRRRIAPPTSLAQRTSWQHLQEVARNVR